MAGAAPPSISFQFKDPFVLTLLVALEGIDGSGKGTQSRLLYDRYLAAGCRVKLLSFPRYSETLFGKSIADFLNGRFGGLHDVNPFLVSLLYAGDRFETRQQLLDALQQHDVVLCDRYVPSNIAHQGAKLPVAEREEFINWIQQIEYQVFQLPTPDLVVLLNLPVDSAQQLIARKESREYTDKPADLHEADSAYLAEVRAVYHSLATGDPHWRIVECLQEDGLRTPTELADAIWKLIEQVRGGEAGGG